MHCESSVALLLLVLLGLAVGLASAGRVPQRPDQTPALATAEGWVERAFGQSNAPVTRAPGLYIIANRNATLRGRTVWDTPLKLSGRTYDHGLYMDSFATLRVVLPQPAERFEAVIGIDDNFSTQSNQAVGSVCFHVLVDGESRYDSKVLRLADGGQPISVPLGGAREFLLEVDDAGDGIGWDQGDWADAAVRLADGARLYLDELPLLPDASESAGSPFSFLYDGVPSADLLPKWEYSSSEERTGDATLRTLTWRDEATGFEVEAQVTLWERFGAVDWVVYLSNQGTEASPLLESFLPLNALAPLGLGTADGQVELTWSNGDKTAEDSFLPHHETLVRGQSRRLESQLSSNQVFPFFNLATETGGCVLAVGWTGDWRTEFLHEAGGAVSLKAGMHSTHFRLQPGERVRGPRIVLLRWEGADPLWGHNEFRRLVFAHYCQQLDGAPALPPMAHNSCATIYQRGMEQLNEAGELALIERQARLGLEAYWMDAYWYPQPWMNNLGNWYPRPEDFPRGLKPLADAAHARGMKFVLWLLPVTVSPGTKWATEHADALYPHLAEQPGLWRIGDPDKRKWLTDWLSGILNEYEVDIYREDGSGMPPEEGPDDRIGIAQMKHVEGLYQYWHDAVANSHAQLMDNCCGGGNRIDLETSKIGFYLWRSDFNDIGEGLKGPDHWPLMARADQVMAGGLALYMPMNTGPVWRSAPYNIRSALTAGLCLYGDLESQLAFPEEQTKAAIAEAKRLRPLFLGDYFPLLSLTTSQRDWYAYQLDRPDLGEGCVLVFRRPDSPHPAVELALYGIDENATYEVSLTGETYEEAPYVQLMGKELASLTVSIKEQPGSTLVRYRRN